MKYSIHPYCEMFPDIDGDDFAALVADIKEYGQQEPIVTYKKQVIDGKNRLRACEEAGKKPEFAEWVPANGEVDIELLAYVLSRNLHRRHLTQSQKAMVAARLANMRPGENQHAKTKGEVAHECATSQTDAAKQLDVSRRAIQQAAEVIEHGSSALVKAVDAGQVAVSDAAKIVDLPKSEQTKAVAAVKSEKATTVTQAAKPKTKKPPAEPKPKEKCPNCGGMKFTTDEHGKACAKCHHPYGEPVGDREDADEADWKVWRRKLDKTLAAALRAVDDLHERKPNRPMHTTMLAGVKALRKQLEGWA